MSKKIRMELSGILPLVNSGRAGELMVIAGPCSAESRRQVLDTARELSGINLCMFRAGVWKPRTKPGGFNGMGQQALEWIGEAKDLTGVPVTIEVATPEHLRIAIDAGVDAVWLGARTVANPFAVQEIADEWLESENPRKFNIGFMVKNPVNPDLDLWIGAFERLYGAGIRRLAAVHRGFSSYNPGAYRNPPEWRIPIEFKRKFPSIPMICDPSHICGNRDLVPIVSQHALNLNFDGLMVEVHNNPEYALSDAAQQLTPKSFVAMMNDLKLPVDANEFDELADFRKEIDMLDDKLIDILAKRMEIAEKIGEFKRRKGMSVMQKDRYDSLVTDRVVNAKAMGLDSRFVKKLLSVIHEESIKKQL